jgi:RNA polymerase sigma-70 factor (ECF subfamily)
MQRFARLERRKSVTVVTEARTLADDHGRARQVVEGIHARNGQQLFGFALRLGLFEDEAADLVQDVLMRLFRSIAQGEDIAEPAAWAYRAAYRLAMDQHRVRRRWRTFVGRLAPPEASAHPNADDLLVVWTEVDRLPPRVRAVLYLRYRADLSFESIGRVLDIEPSSARAHAARGIARIRDRLADR